MSERCWKYRMHFDLVHGRHDGRSRKQTLEVIGHEVAHADGAHLAVGQQLLECSVGVEGEIKLARQRLMQQEQVEAIDSEFAGGLVERVERRVVSIVANPDFGLEEHFIARNAGPSPTLARPDARSNTPPRCR